jgi:small-conductance mechanosensitive channel
MINEDRCGPSGMRIARALARFAIRGLVGTLLIICPAAAQQNNEHDGIPPQVRELVRILDDPQVRSWLKSHEAETAAINESPGPDAHAQPTSPSEYLAARVVAVRQHLVDLVEAWPTLPAQFANASAILSQEPQRRGQGLLLIALFVLLGVLAEFFLRWSASGFMNRVYAKPLKTTIQHLQTAGLRLGYGIALTLAFAIGSIGMFLVSDWPPLLREIVVGYLFVFVIARAALALCWFVTSPDDDRLRLLPIGQASASHWCRRTTVIVGWFVFGWVTASLLIKLGFTVPARQLVSYMLGFALLGLGLEATWQSPAGATDGHSTAPRPATWRMRNALLSTYFVLIWLLWAAGMMPAFWFAVIALALPMSIRLVDEAVEKLLQPVAAGTPESRGFTAYRVLAERGARAVLIIAAAVLLARAWGIDFASLTATDTVATRLLRGAISAVVIILVADIAWRIIRELIDRKLGERADASPGTAEARARSRMHTLLPILRNVLFVVLITMAVLMVLSAMGVEIGPLIAGAGVAGVAIGFGAQTLVKDIISGVFYLLDDAFRVGEYIQSGSYKGTVESFSLRSVKLRHHRGPLYTVPFGELGAVQNMSRDWVIDKMMVGITYDSDLDKARKIIKQIGKELAADPEFAPHIIEPLKMQGVEQFGDYAIQIRMKMMTKPNEQFTIRRKALAMIKKAFDANGIHFAFPTVQVAGGEVGAAAQQALAMSRAAASHQ